MDEQTDKDKMGHRSDIDKTDKTVAVTSRHFLRRKAQETHQGEQQTDPAAHQVTLWIRGMVEQVYLDEDRALVMGRAHIKTRYYPDIDLNPYGAKERGVSREHAQLHVSAGSLYITDLGSANGTFVAGKAIEPRQPYELRSGEEFLVAQLAIKVVYGEDA